MDYFCLASFSPAPCSPPLGGSDGNSAVRFTPAVKYGGREKWPFGRETRCIDDHPCRAHHKLKWARTEQSVLGVLYELLPRSESSNEISTQILVVLKLRRIDPHSTGLATTPNHPPRVQQSSCASNGSRSGPANTTSPHSQPQRPCERTKSRNKLPKERNLRSQAAIEHLRPAEATVWSEQGSTATISTKYRKTAHQ